MNTAISTKPIRVGISRQNNVVHAQHLIDGIFQGEKLRHGSTMEFNNCDILSTGNHIDLDNPNALVESVDVQIARIFSAQEKSQTYITMRTVLQKHVLPFLKKLARSTKLYSVISAKQVAYSVIKLDYVCEKILFGIPSFFESVSTEQKAPAVQKAEKREIVSVPFQVREAERNTFVEPVYVPTQKSTAAVPSAQHNTQNNTSKFIQILAILYVELRYGGRLKNIDSV